MCVGGGGGREGGAGKGTGERISTYQLGLARAPHTCINLSHTHKKKRVANLECLDSHRQVLSLQHCLVDLSVLASSQLLAHVDVRPVQLPPIHVMRQAVDGGFAGIGGRVVQNSRQSVRVLGVVHDQFGQRVKLGLGCHVALAVGVVVDAVVEDAAVVAQGDGVLAWLTLTLSDQETAVDARTQAQLRLGPGDVAMEPGVLLQTVHLGDVGGGHPADLPLVVGGLTPVPVLTLPGHLQLIPLPDGQLPWLVCGVAVFGYVEVRVLFFCCCILRTLKTFLRPIGLAVMGSVS